MKNKKKIAVITIHKGNFKNLFKTIRSIQKQSLKPDLHLIVINKIGFNHSQIFMNKYTKLIINKDYSIYHALNLALKKTFDHNVIFINSGDELDKSDTIKIIKSKILYNKCLIFKTKVIDGNRCYYPYKKFYQSKNYSPHPSFIRPPITKNKIFYMNENIKISADGEWMKNCIKTFNVKKIPVFSSKFYTGGISTKPSFKSVIHQTNYNCREGINEFIKYLIYKLFKKHYFKIIFFKKFYKI